MVSETDFLSGKGDPLSGLGSFAAEAPGLPQLLAEASAGAAGTVHRPETPRQVATQLAEAFAAKGEQKVDVSLNPQELGQVRMRVSASETGITVMIQAERPETGDLMRRHIHELAEEFRRMGYENISFEFGGGQSGGAFRDGGAGAEHAGAAASAGPGAPSAEPENEPAKQNLRLGSAGVDMRV
ncbi:flagellar hook-length control protein FliK [Cribrihabitans pelagius]|uniref:flagellar hook-length control protein FliK n=1 Tax=Cribrihabitans pelagius TaxID=1765746 RepID=UPI003B5A9235